MKKWMYLVSGVIIGALVTTAGSVFADQIKSLVGEKVTGEYTVVVNGKALQDKGAVINGRTNVPVRGISEALGVNMKVDGKTIRITTDEKSAPSNQDGGNTSNENNDYQKSSLLTQKSSLETEIKRLQEVKKDHERKYNEAESGFGKEVIKQGLDSTIQKISEKERELDKVNEDLTALDK
ncbi:copper amine oxidase N-terminal domain-containing protein [Paenibacillus alvei]|uniref:Copper amine oxidase N-terminal domain-containing protein n=1 Tax=Paenibacillus alvei TaxID=44250 RepID=A0ABT4GWJ5_PAEAL|nr:stalk domain-containing protein [Paenibacillus alvei]MCY9760933.1 copper amine oxidase N-terminal domain-containing protein [Paenibacillus alvei]MCY9768853.1 copper amine oxidase N-terminal domain-containing protein [Paenibacillus alvei]